jgi:hypothetical protein
VYNFSRQQSAISTQPSAISQDIETAKHAKSAKEKRREDRENCGQLRNPIPLFSFFFPFFLFAAFAPFAVNLLWLMPDC